MRLTFDQVVRYFNESLWYAANRAKLGIWDREDVYQQLLIQVCEHDFPVEPTECRRSGITNDWNPAHIIRFIKSRAIDLSRKEQPRRCLPQDTIPERGRSQDDLPRLQVAEILESVDEYDRRILELIMQPDTETVALAQRDFDQAQTDRRSGKLRMNINEVHVHNKHVAERLGITLRQIGSCLGRARLAALGVHAAA